MPLAVGVLWTALAGLAIWFVFQDEEIPDDGGALVAAQGLALAIVFCGLWASSLSSAVISHRGEFSHEI
jgi:hypothetical protein